MNNKTRLFTILFSITLAILLVWPNIGERTIHVKFKESLSVEDQKLAAQELGKFLQNFYSDKYSWEINDKPEIEVIIKGSFVQTAFLNELGRQNGVDSSRVTLEKMWVEENLMARPFKLGLDLQGGMNLVLEADFDKLKTQLERQYPQAYREDLQKRMEAETDSKKKASLETELKQIAETLNFSDARKKADTEGALEIIRSRIDKTGVSEPLIRLQGSDKVEISLPGVASPEQAKKVISSTARVEYRLGEKTGSNYSDKANEFFNEYIELDSDFKRQNFITELERKINLPPDLGIYVFQSKTSNSEKGSALKPVYFKVLENEVSLSGDSMSRNVYSNFDPETVPPQYTVEFELTSAGREKFAQLTTDNKGRELAILIDGMIRSHPRINEPITGGRARITGNFTQQESRDRALILREGALPVPMKIVEERSVGPSLGQESIENGLTAILFGLLAIVTYMVLYYHAFGLIANLALVLNLLFMSALFALMDFTITLPGLAGVVLTLGMAVDANVIVYERIKEELKKGKKLITAISLGFENATRTILDSNLTTLIAAIILASKLGSGPIKGFGVTLFVGILSTLFTTLFINRSLIFALVIYMGIKKISIGWGKTDSSAVASQEAK